jgi:hypothetical protein
MNPRVLAAALGAAVVIGGAVWLLLPGASRSSQPAIGEPVATAPSTGAAEGGASPTPTPEAPVAGAARAPRRPGGGGAPAAAAPPSEAPAAPAAVAGSLRIDSDVPGAQVFIDRQFVGTTPVTAENVSPGTHQLNVAAEGFDGIARTIEVEAGARDLMVRFKEVRLDLRLPVVHRHRMGACNGTLVATTQGLRYETDDKDDRFAAAFADLEAFQVDYAEKNLRVRVRKGKQYNFTDPGGNADKLFVFHRDVDKARQRLAGGATAATD